ncbi:MAG: TlpA family protein disulfide reductase [Asticcacaulis sp.]|uniref:TlpA family protein disulfide reductase n=1 Tax=Asticcacaulis sp. TaxID=1872648 RepID=UPI003F7B6288
MLTPIRNPRPIRQRALKFTVRTFDHKTFSPAQMAGNDVLLNYWATWCGPCPYELPVIDA